MAVKGEIILRTKLLIGVLHVEDWQHLDLFFPSACNYLRRQLIFRVINFYF